MSRQKLHGITLNGTFRNLRAMVKCFYALLIFFSASLSLNSQTVTQATLGDHATASERRAESNLQAAKGNPLQLRGISSRHAKRG